MYDRTGGICSLPDSGFPRLALAAYDVVTHLAVQRLGPVDQPLQATYIELGDG